MAQINPQTASPNHSELEPQSKAESIGKSEDYGMHDESVTSKAATALKLDQNGFPLRPQPSDDPKDPLNWNRWLKLWVLIQVSVLAFLGPFSHALINSAYVPLAAAMHVTVVEASYQTTICIVFAGVAPIFWSPLSNVYGRRPVLVLVTALGVAAHAASAAASSWGGILAARAFVGIGTSAGMGIGAAVVSDLYFMHERGKYMGIYVVFVTNGAHIALIAGGYTALHLGWRWCYWIPAIIFGCTWLINLLFLPETLYRRNRETGQSLQESKKSWISLFDFRGNRSGRKLRAGDFLHPLLMLKYPSVLLTTIYYSITFGLGSVLFAVTAAATFGSIYHFNTAQIGLAVGISTTVGTLLGEITAGPVSDYLVYLYRRSHEGDVKSETRLQATLPGALLVPIGLAIEGTCLEYRTHFMGPVMGIGIAAFGLQIVSTNIFAYVIDCYKPQSAELSTLLNFGRQVFSFTLGFYMIPFANATNYGTAWGVFAIIDFVLYGGVVALILRGQQWRAKLGEPDFHKEI